MSCMSIAFHNCIELQYFKSVFFSLFKTIQDELLPDMLTTLLRTYCVAGITDMSTATYIIRV